MKLTPKQERFVKEYLIDLNSTQAAIRAGYSAKSADKIGSQLLGKTRVAEAIEVEKEKRGERLDIKADRVLQEIARLAFSDLRKAIQPGGGLLDLDQLDDDTAAAVASVEVIEEKDREGNTIGFTKKLKLWDKPKAIDLACKHLGLTKEKFELTGKDGGPIKTEETVMSDEERLDQINKLVLAVKAKQAQAQLEGASDGVAS